MSQQRGGDRAMIEKQVFTTGEAAQVCGVSQQTIIRCFDSGRLGGFRVPGSRFRRIPRTDLLGFMKENGIPVDSLGDEKPKVLVVDDDTAMLKLVEEVLMSAGDFEVETATNGYDAGLLTERFGPDIILLDYMLPDINGNVVCERIKRNPDTESIQIIFVSGAVNRTEIDGLLAVGADGFIAKPFDPKELVDCVRSRVATR